jgi:hypothetical protein
MRPRDFIFGTVFILGSIISLYFLHGVDISGAAAIEWVTEDSYVLNESAAITINLFAAFSSSSPLNFTVAEQPELYVVLDGGNLLVAPAPGASGSIPLTITAEDGTQIVQKKLTFVSESNQTAELNQTIFDEDGSVIGKKIEDEIAYETNINFAGILGQNFIIKLQHNASSALAVWVEGVEAAFSDTIAEPNTEITVVVPLENNSIPYFKLHVGNESEVFEFGPLTFSPSTILSCGSVAASDTLGANLSAAGTCINITASNIALDCAGFTIVFDTGGSNITAGINVTNQSNISIRNCIIIDGSAEGNEGHGIAISNSNNSLSLNNTIYTNGTFHSIGISIYNSSMNNSVINNTIFTTGSDLENFGIDLDTGAYLNYLFNNTIQTNGTSGNAGFTVEAAHNNTIANNSVQTNGTGSLNTGITILTFATNNTVENNTFITNGTSIGIGIRLLTGVNYTKVFNNSVQTQGISLNNLGIWILGSSSHNNVTKNFVRTSGTTGNHGLAFSTSALNNTIANNDFYPTGIGSNNNGVFISASSNNTFIYNRMSTSGTENNYGIRELSGASNNTFDTNNITTTGGVTSYGIVVTTASYSNFTSTVLNKTIEWINTSSTGFINITNTTFANDNGSIRFVPRIELNSALDIIQNNTNITFNNTMLNTTNLSFLNVSAQITLLGLPFISAIPLVEVNEDGIFQTCYTTCTPVSYSSGTFIFNVTQFSNHSSTENTTSIVITSGNFTANITPEQTSICTFQTDNLSAADGCFVVVSSAFNGTALSILNNGTAAFGLNITPDVCPFNGACIQQVKANGTAGLPNNASCNPALNFITVTAGVPTNIHKNVPAGEQVFVSLNYTFAINGTPPGFKIVAYNFTTVSDFPYFDPAC